VRGTGDTKLVMVPGYQWSHAHSWVEHHPQGWIADPADRFRYAAHHYWLRDGSKPYEDAVAEAVQQGFG
jgi:hypothetical protein